MVRLGWDGFCCGRPETAAPNPVPFQIDLVFHTHPAVKGTVSSFNHLSAPNPRRCGFLFERVCLRCDLVSWAGGKNLKLSLSHKPENQTRSYKPES